MSLVRRVDVVKAGDVDKKISDPDWVFSNRRGDLLGRGSYKQVFAVKGHPELAVVKSDPSHIREHSQELAKLAELGVPTAVYEAVGNGTALVKRYAAGSKSDHDYIRFWKRRTVDDLVKILRTCRTKGVYFSDFQVLIGKDGEMVLSDPLTLETGEQWVGSLPGFHESVVRRVAERWASAEGGSTEERERQIMTMVKAKGKVSLPKKKAKKAKKKAKK